MVASQDPSSPCIVILGCTGAQGGSVARALLASTKPYRLVGITRDVSKPASKEWEQRGVRMRQATVAVGNESAVREAFEGAEVVFVSV